MPFEMHAPCCAAGRTRSRAARPRSTRTSSAERVLGLPREPDPYIDAPWEEVPALVTHRRLARLAAVGPPVRRRRAAPPRPRLDAHGRRSARRGRRPSPARLRGSRRAARAARSRCSCRTAPTLDHDDVRDLARGCGLRPGEPPRPRSRGREGRSTRPTRRAHHRAPAATTCGPTPLVVHARTPRS